MSLFKNKTKAPEHSRIIGIYTAQTKTVSVMDSPDTETKSPNVLDILSYHQSVYIIDDFNQEYFKVILRYQPNKIGYVKNLMVIILCILHFLIQCLFMKRAK